MPEEGRDVGANSDANDATIWRPVAKAAQIETVSVRAVQRRCQSGKYRSRRVQTPQGERLEVDAATLTTAGRDDGRERRDAQPQERRDAPTPEPTRGDAPDLAARYVERLESEVDFLRRALEQRDRDAAELRAALREALKAQPRQLEAPAKSLEIAQEGRQSDATQPSPEAPTPAKSPDNARSATLKKEPRPLWKIMLGIR